MPSSTRLPVLTMLSKITQRNEQPTDALLTPLRRRFGSAHEGAPPLHPGRRRAAAGRQDHPRAAGHRVCGARPSAMPAPTSQPCRAASGSSSNGRRRGSKGACRPSGRGAGPRRDPEDPRLVRDRQTPVGRGHACPASRSRWSCSAPRRFWCSAGSPRAWPGGSRCCTSRTGRWPEMQEAFGWSLDQYVYYGGYPGAAPLDRRARALGALRPRLARRDDDRPRRPAAVAGGQARPAPPAVRARLQYSGQILSYTKMLGQLQDAGNTTTLAHYLDLLPRPGCSWGCRSTPGRRSASAARVPSSRC